MRPRLSGRALVGAAIAVAVVAAGAGGYAVGRRSGLASGRDAALAGIDREALSFAELLAQGDSASDRPNLADLCESGGNAMSRPTKECADLAGPKARPLPPNEPALAAAAGRYATAIRQAADVGDRDARSLALVRSAGAALGSGMVLAGIADSDADGLDDDGLVEVSAGSRAACVVLPLTSNYTVEVRAMSCSALGAHPHIANGDASYGPKTFPRSYLQSL